LRTDASGDGVITAADLEARSAERIGWFQKKKLHVLDKDSDGKVSREEFTARAQQRFADLDLDRDGKITTADLPPGMATRWEKKSAPKGDAGRDDDKGAKSFFALRVVIAAGLTSWLAGGASLLDNGTGYICFTKMIDRPGFFLT
jgi:EF hand